MRDIFKEVAYAIVGAGKSEICKANSYSHETELFILWESSVFALKDFR